MSTAPLLEAAGMTRRFGGLVAVNDVSFDVRPGEIFGLIGPNGAGKTTLFNLLSGVLRRSSGTFTYQGRDISRLPPWRIARLGIARTFQNIRLFPDLSAADNVTISQYARTRASLLAGVCALPASRAEERRVRARAHDLLGLIGLSDRATVRARDLPYGDQRRLEIARALALQPTVLLLDEPAAGLNSGEKGEFTRFVRRVRDEFDLTVLIIEHHVPLVMGLCDRIAVLNFGRLIACGDPSAVRADPQVIDAYLGSE